MYKLLNDFSLSAVTAGILTVIVAFASSCVLLFQAASAAHLDQSVTASWIWAVSIGSGLSCLFLSMKMRVPVIAAWSTPGAALLITMLPTVPYAEALCAYMVCALLTIIIGMTGSLDKLMKRIPPSISAGLLAGILYSIATNVYTSLMVEPFFAFSMFLMFLLVKRISPRFAVLTVMFVGIILCFATNKIIPVDLHFSFTLPVFIYPEWSTATVLSLTLPLAVVNLTGQYISGMAVLHASGFPVSSNKIMTVTGLASLLLAPFSAHAINLSSLTAAICTGPESNKDPNKRYIAGIVCGIFYIFVGTFGLTLATLFAALPSVYLSVLAGLALLGAFTTGISGIVTDTKNIEAGIITFLVTASGIKILGLSSPFWGLLLGSCSYIILQWRKK